VNLLATQLDLSDIIDVTVSVSSNSVSTETFNQGLIIGTSTIIPAATRLQPYNGLSAMITAGFPITSPEYIAASLYFSAKSAPSTLWIGRQNTTNGAIANFAIANAGSGYNLNDILTVEQSGGLGATLTVSSVSAAIAGSNTYTLTTNFATGATVVFDGVTFTAVTSSATGNQFVVGGSTTISMTNLAAVMATNSTIGAAYSVTSNNNIITVTEKIPGNGNTPGTMTITGTGAVTAGTATTSTAQTVTGATLTTAGTGYGIGNGLATTDATSAGTGCTINISQVGETPLTAIQACRAASNAWYACVATAAVKADHIAIAAYVESMKPNSIYMYTTQDADALAGTTGNVLQTLNSLGYTRSFGQYSTTSQAVAATMGEAMGLNTGLANSAYTLMFKQLTGVASESLAKSQVNVITTVNGNVYINYNDEYNTIQQGTMAAPSTFFDQIINRDMLVNTIQQNIMNLLTSSNKVSYTDAGGTSIIHQINTACAAAVTLGYLSPGTWDGATIMNLTNGQALTNGYLVQCPAVSTATSAQKAARQFPPMYLAIIEAGAIHGVVLAINVQAA
jgi:hypothetical protein